MKIIKLHQSDYVDDPNLAIQPNYKVYTLLNNQIIEKYIPSNNPIFDKNYHINIPIQNLQKS